MENGKLLRTSLMAVTGLVVGLVLLSVGFVAGHYTAGASFTRFMPGTPFLFSGVGGTPADLNSDFAPFWEAWNVVHQEYVDQPLDDQKLAYGAIKGMVQALGDAHSGYDTPDEANILLSDTSGALEGIGAEVAASGGGIEIVSPLPGSPAEAAGILPGDVIIAVNGEDTTGQDLFTVINKVRGPAGTKVDLKIVRTGEADPLTFTITRAKITIPSVESKILDGNIGYVKINSFGETTTSEFKTQLGALMDQKPVGLVLDLRNNPGGFRDAAIDIASQFIGEGPIMFQKYGDGRQEEFTAKPGGLALDVPLVVLVNSGSASASEIVTGAIQDDGRGKVLGEQSYGKGTVQDWHQLSNNEGSVRITIARWLTPKERTIDKVGITPDVVVPLTSDDRAAKRDPQLDAAVKLLTGK